jgi:hypothetical protein
LYLAANPEHGSVAKLTPVVGAAPANFGDEGVAVSGQERTSGAKDGVDLTG